MKAKRLTSNSGGECELYEIILDKDYTVESLLNEILTKREWGYFSVNGGSRCEYRFGKLLTHLSEIDLPKKVISVKTLGGYCRFNYEIEVTKGGEQ